MRFKKLKKFKLATKEKLRLGLVAYVAGMCKNYYADNPAENEEKMMYDLTIWNREQTRSFGYNDDFWKMPTHRVEAMPDYSKILGVHEFVIYGNPLARDYGKINGHSNKTAEPLKLSLVGNDPEWQVAVANWFESELFDEQPYGLNELIRRPRTAGHRHYRIHYARFLLPMENSYARWDKRWSPSFTAYYIGTGEDRLFFSEFIIDAAYNAEPTSWNQYGDRAYTIPQDWITNRIDENKDKYTLFA